MIGIIEMLYLIIKETTPFPFFGVSELTRTKEPFDSFNHLRRTVRVLYRLVKNMQAL
jgi:hypothetical protein